MTQIQVPIEHLAVTAQAFARAAADAAALQARLDQHMVGLAQEWHEANRQAFFGAYAQASAQLSQCAQLLTLISREMKSMAERYESVDHG